METQLTTTELKEHLISYAKDDLECAKKEGSIMITGTKLGLIIMNYENGLFQAFNNMGSQFTEKIPLIKMAKWLSKQYEVVH